MRIEIPIVRNKKRTLFMRFLNTLRYIKSIDIRKVLWVLVALISFDIFINGVGLANQRKLYKEINDESYQAMLIDQQTENARLRTEVANQGYAIDNLLKEIERLKAHK